MSGSLYGNWDAQSGLRAVERVVNNKSQFQKVIRRSTGVVVSSYLKSADPSSHRAAAACPTTQEGCTSAAFTLSAFFHIMMLKTCSLRATTITTHQQKTSSSTVSNKQVVRSRTCNAPHIMASQRLRTTCCVAEPGSAADTKVSAAQLGLSCQDECRWSLAS